MLTKEEFDNLGNEEIFATGILPNSPEGLFMTNAGSELRWVAVKGYTNCWTIYCHWSKYSAEWIYASGDKVINEHNIRRCVPCEDEVFEVYRF